MVEGNLDDNIHESILPLYVISGGSSLMQSNLDGNINEAQTILNYYYISECSSLMLEKLDDTIN